MDRATRRRIHLTETPRLAAIIDRNAMPGEPRASTVARLVERADVVSAHDDDFLVFHPDRAPISTEQVADLMEAEDADMIAESQRG